MGAPITNYITKSSTGLSINFLDRSSGVPTVWEWDFGFLTAGNPTLSTQQNPTQLFPKPGTYKVSLKASNDDGESILSKNLVINVGIIYPYTIKDLVALDLPNNISLNEQFFEITQNKWFLFFKDGQSPVVEEENIYEEAYYKPILRNLIAKLIVHDFLEQSINSAIQSSLNSFQQGGSQGGIKKVETGPTNAEWHDKTDQIANLTKAGNKNSNSPIDRLKDEICQLASRAQVYLPMCGECKIPNTFEIFKNNSCY